MGIQPAFCGPAERLIKNASFEVSTKDYGTLEYTASIKNKCTLRVTEKVNKKIEVIWSANLRDLNGDAINAINIKDLEPDNKGVYTIDCPAKGGKDAVKEASMTKMSFKGIPLYSKSKKGAQAIKDSLFKVDQKVPSAKITTERLPYKVVGVVEV